MKDKPDRTIYGNFGKYRRHYERYADTGAGRKLFSAANIILNEIRLHKSPDNRILDLGCGGGGLIRELARAGFSSVLGIDIAWNQVRVAKAGGEVVQADTLRLPLQPGSFDMIIAADVLEHVPDPGMFLREAGRVLKEGGELVLSVPNDRNFFFSKLWALKFGKLVRKHGHLHNFSDRNEFVSFLGANRCRVSKVLESRPPAYLFGAIIERLGDRLGESIKSSAGPVPGDDGDNRREPGRPRRGGMIYGILRFLYHLYLDSTALRLTTQRIYIANCG